MPPSRIVSFVATVIAAGGFGPSCGGAEVLLVPAAGGKSGGVDVRVEGRGFSGRGPAIVHFGSEAAKSVVIEGDRLIRVKSPTAEATGIVDVTITFEDGSVEHLPQSFTISEDPAVEILTPGAAN